MLESRRTFQKEGTASVKVLRQEYTMTVQRTARSQWGLSIVNKGEKGRR